MLSAAIIVGGCRAGPQRSWAGRRPPCSALLRWEKWGLSAPALHGQGRRRSPVSTPWQPAKCYGVVASGSDPNKGKGTPDLPMGRPLRTPVVSTYKSAKDWAHLTKP
jgi:hypothetical protein